MRIYATIDIGIAHNKISLVEVNGIIQNKPVTFLIDSGSIRTFISSRVLSQLEL